MTTPISDAEWHAWQQTVSQELGVVQHFFVDAERERRIKFLADYLERNSLKTYVLGAVVASIPRLPAGWRS
jgi:hypothetical protein